MVSPQTSLTPNPDPPELSPISVKLESYLDDVGRVVLEGINDLRFQSVGLALQSHTAFRPEKATTMNRATEPADGERESGFPVFSFVVFPQEQDWNVDVDPGAAAFGSDGAHCQLANYLASRILPHGRAVLVKWLDPN